MPSRLTKRLCEFLCRCQSDAITPRNNATAITVLCFHDCFLEWPIANPSQGLFTNLCPCLSIRGIEHVGMQGMVSWGYMPRLCNCIIDSMSVCGVLRIVPLSSSWSPDAALCVCPINVWRHTPLKSFRLSEKHELWVTGLRPVNFLFSLNMPLGWKPNCQSVVGFFFYSSSLRRAALRSAETFVKESAFFF